jgi:tRNA A37 threonylcarbamoyladenosine dehydratase
MQVNKMKELFIRSAAMLGEDNMERLHSTHVLVFGLGGVGGHAAETLCRGGIGILSLVDSEKYDCSNCNRQIFATSETIGKEKTEAAKDRLTSINPDCEIRTYSFFYGKDPTPPSLFDGVDYILDAIDTVSAKMMLIEEAKKRNIPIISCMGTGNKLDPTRFRVVDIKHTKVCPLARVIRSECKKRGIESLKVLYSEEEPVSGIVPSEYGRHAPGSVSFVPGVAGMILAGEIIKDIIK